VPAEPHGYKKEVQLASQLAVVLDSEYLEGWLSTSGDSGHRSLIARGRRHSSAAAVEAPLGLSRGVAPVHGEGPGTGGEAAGRQVHQWVPGAGAVAAWGKPAGGEIPAARDQERPADGRLEGGAAPQRGGQRAEPPQPGGRLLVHPALAGRGPPAAGAAQDALEGGHRHAVLHQGLPRDHLRSGRPPGRAGRGGGGYRKREPLREVSRVASHLAED
jgi:hypothetical protein